MSAQASGPMISFDTETFDYGEITKAAMGFELLPLRIPEMLRLKFRG